MTNDVAGDVELILELINDDLPFCYVMGIVFIIELRTNKIKAI